MRLIDADALDFGKVFIGASDFAKDCRDGARSVVDAAPTVDAVPVVRCKDCVYLGFKDFRGICEHGPVCTMIDPDSYCAWGRKKEDTP